MRLTLLLLFLSNYLAAQYPDIVTLDPVESVQEDPKQQGIEFHRLNPIFSPIQIELEKNPGLSFSKRGIDSYELMIRGLSRERIQTSFNDVILIDASPTQTASPLEVLFNTNSRISIEHNKTGSLGSAIYFDFSPEEASSQFNFLIDENRKGYASNLDLKANQESFSARTLIHSKNLGNYKSGDNKEIAAKNATNGITSQLSFNSENYTYRLFGLYSHQDEIINTSLPLDTLDSDCFLIGADGQYKELSWVLGYSKSTPFLSNEKRPNTNETNKVEADSEAISYNGKLDYKLNEETTIGLQFWHQNRNTIRKRSNAVDHIWPDAYQSEFELYLDKAFDHKGLEVHFSSMLKVLRADAKSADKNAFGRPINELFASYNQGDPDNIDNTDWAGAINLIIQYNKDSKNHYMGLNLKRTSPGISQRYRAFVPALGGDGKGNTAFEIGNPYLDMENSFELVTGTRWTTRKLSIKMEAYYRQINNYATRSIIGETTSPAPPAPGLIVYGFNGINATFYGLELSGNFKITQELSLESSLDFIEAKNLDTNKKLVELASNQASIQLKYQRIFSGFEFSSQLECLYTDKNNNPSPELLPIYQDSSNYSIFNLKFQIQQEKHLIAMFIENIFDKNYYDYLQTPVYGELQEGDLKAGDRIAGKGRSYYISYQFNF